MAKSKYLNWKDYAENDPYYLITILKDELHKPRSKMEFQDGTTYHVTKSGSRYWSKGDYMHNEYGVAGKWSPTEPGRYYLYSVQFLDEQAWQVALNNLNQLRELTDNRLEEIVEMIAKNIKWEKRQGLWTTLLTSNKDSNHVLERVIAISDEFNRLTKMTDDFIEEFGH
jgi:hypothetical protein